MDAGSGLYYISTTSGGVGRQGQYTVQISSVTLNGVVYGVDSN